MKVIKSAIKINNLKGKINRKKLLRMLYKKTKDVFLVQRFINHSPVEQTIRYIGLSEDEINEEYKNFGV